MVHLVLLVQRAVNYLLDSTDVVLILKLCVVMMGNTAVLMVCSLISCTETRSVATELFCQYWGFSFKLLVAVDLHGNSCLIN